MEMKMLTFATIAACCAGAAAAAPSDDMVGTWECRQPGVNYRNKPPILYVDSTSAAAPDKAAFALDVDGFTREVYGNSDVTADADGWWKISPSKGEAFMVRPQGSLKSRTASMELKRAGTTYRCLRLPLSGGVPSTVIQRQQGQGVPPAGDAEAPPSGGQFPRSGEQGVPPAMQNEGAAVKKEY
jgi:hypothetical protein